MRRAMLLLPFALMAGCVRSPPDAGNTPEEPLAPLPPEGRLLALLTWTCRPQAWPWAHVLAVHANASLVHVVVEARAGRDWRALTEGQALGWANQTLAIADATGIFRVNRFSGYDSVTREPTNVAVTHEQHRVLSEDELTTLRVLVRDADFERAWMGSETIEDGHCTLSYSKWDGGSSSILYALDEQGPSDVDRLREELLALHDLSLADRPAVPDRFGRQPDGTCMEEISRYGPDEPPGPKGEPIRLPEHGILAFVGSRAGLIPYPQGAVTVVYANGTLVHLYLTEHVAPKTYWPYLCPPAMPEHQARAVLDDLNATGVFNATRYGWDPSGWNASAKSPSAGYHITHASRVALDDDALRSLRVVIGNADFPHLNETYCCPTTTDAGITEFAASVDGEFHHVDVIGPAPQRLWDVSTWLGWLHQD